MSKKSSPRHGSLQYWPRKRAKKQIPRIRSWPDRDEKGLLGFAGYKVGMTHITEIDQIKNSPTKGKRISTPVTVIECPSLILYGVRVYENDIHGSNVSKEISNPPKELSRKLSLPKKDKGQKVVEFLNELSDNLENYSFIRALVATKPKETGFSKKKPDIFEMALGGNINDQYEYVKENIGKEISVSDIFSEGVLTDVHAVSKGKGFQGTVKRFGISLRSHKSEKGRRGPGSIGDWKGTTYDVPMSGQTGYHLRTDYNKRIMYVSDDVEKVNANGGFLNYGLVKSSYILMKGSVPGPKKRLIRFNYALRPHKNVEKNNPKVIAISKESKQ